MIYKVAHRISYSYSAPVFLEPHTVRLHPRNSPCQQIRHFTLAVTPQPAGLHHFLDAEGNHATCLWFEEMTDALTITTSFEARTFCANPFSYLVTDQDFLHLPARYPGSEAASLAPFMGAVGRKDEVGSFCATILAEAEGNTLDFLNRLCTSIYENFTVEIRDQGSARDPAVTLRYKRGACRDLALLFMEVCRNAGLAARFVSGYQEGDADMEDRHLHAWAEVYITGGGWQGYDPTLGLAVADRHIPVAVGHNSDGAAAVAGTFRGTGVTAGIDYRISLAAYHG